MADQKEKPRDPTEPISMRRPIVLTLLILFFVLWIILGWLRLAETLAARQLILENLSPGFFWYFLLSGLAWGVAGLPVLWGLICGRQWTLNMLWITGLFYPFFYWLERLFLWKDPDAQSNWPFMLILTIVWFGLLSLVWRSKRVSLYLSKKSKRMKIRDD